MVLEASYQTFNTDATQSFSSKVFSNNKPAVAGKWVNLSGVFDLDILVGERPGGVIGGGLMVQRKGQNYKKRGDGSPIIPLFSTVPVTSSVKRRINAYRYEIEESTPVFKVLH
jgi:hypothetical protein